MFESLNLEAPESQYDSLVRLRIDAFPSSGLTWSIQRRLSILRRIGAVWPRMPATVDVDSLWRCVSSVRLALDRSNLYRHDSHAC